MTRCVKNWMADAFFGMHYDLHATAFDHNLGAELTPEMLEERLRLVRPDFVQCDCKGHPGFASYPTRVGYAAPGIVRDALRIHRDVTRKLGIPLLVHYSGLWDDQAITHHPEWGMRTAAGDLVNPWAGIYDRPRTGGGIACLTGPYLQQLMIPQLLEILDEYEVDGFWIDGENWALRECYCERCRAEFTRRTGIAAAPVERTDPAWTAWRRFHMELFVEYVRRYTDAVHRHRPSCLVCSNWMYSMRQPGAVTVPVDFLSGDFMSSFGCERAQMEGRYLAGHGMPWNLMAWGFCTPDDDIPRQVKELAGLCQEAAEVGSCGGGMLIYADPQRSGYLCDWQHRIFAGVGAFVRERQPFSQHTESVPEAVVLHGDGHSFRHNTLPHCMGNGFHAAEGTLHILMENHWHVDIQDENRLLERLGDYKLVAIGEQDDLTPELTVALERYAAAGGVAILSGSRMAGAQGALLGVAPDGDIRHTPWFLAVDGEAATGGGGWQPVALREAEAYAPFLADQQPGKDETPFPAVTIRRVGAGKIVGIHGDLMWSYYQTHQPRLRRFFAQLLRALAIPHCLEVEAQPSVEVTLRRKGGSLLVHLVNRAVNPCLTPRLHMVEEVPPSGPAVIRLRCGAPQSVRLQPGAREVAWQYNDGTMECRIESVAIHDILEVK